MKQKGMIKTPRKRWLKYLIKLNFLNSNEKWTMALQRHCIIEKISELNQPVYFKDVLTSEWKLRDVGQWERGFVLISSGEEKL